MFLFVLSLISASAEFPICTASGDQLYPDVCWDGEGFWVVWQDEEQGTIRGVRVNEDGELLTDEVELLEKGADPGPVRYPCVAAAPDRLAVEARVMMGYNEFGTDMWGVMHQEFSPSGELLFPQPARLSRSWIYNSGNRPPSIFFSEQYFFTFFAMGQETPMDAHAFNVTRGLYYDSTDGHVLEADVWVSSEIGFEDYAPVPCWDGERFLVIFWDVYGDYYGGFLEDTLAFQYVGGQFEIDVPFRTTFRSPIKYQTLVSGGSRFFWGSNTGGPLYHSMIGYCILDSLGSLIDTVIKFDFYPAYSYYPDAMFNGENFVCVWENRLQDEGIDLYSIKVDTFGNIIDSGYVVLGSDTAYQPAITAGSARCLLAWSDNRDGNFNIYGMLLDAEGIAEPATPPLTHPATIAVDQTVFTDVLKINLSAAAAGGTVIIHDALGRVVKRIEVEGRSGSCVWDGRNSRGDDAGEGVYFVSLAGKTRNARLKVIKIK